MVTVPPFTYCSLFGQQRICLALFVCCSLWPFMAAAELNFGISKGINTSGWHEPFPDPSQTWRVFTDNRHELGSAWKTFYCLFSDHQQTAMQTQESCLFQRMTKVPVHVERLGTKQLKQCAHKDSTVSHMHTSSSNPQSSSQTGQPVSGDRQHSLLINTCTHLQIKNTQTTNK